MDQNQKDHDVIITPSGEIRLNLAVANRFLASVEKFVGGACLPVKGVIDQFSIGLQQKMQQKGEHKRVLRELKFEAKKRDLQQKLAVDSDPTAAAQTQEELDELRGELQALRERTVQRLTEEETAKQVNREDVTREILEHLSDDAKPEQVDPDWIMAFYAQCEKFSNAQKQSLWARAYAEKARNPSRLGLRVLHALKDIEPAEIETLSAMYRFCWRIPSPNGGIFLLLYLEGPNAPIYESNGLPFDSLIKLSDIGIVNISPLTPHILICSLPEIRLQYFGRTLLLDCGSSKTFPIGQVRISPLGQELLNIVCGTRTPVPGLFDYIKERLEPLRAREVDFKVSKEPGISLHVFS